MKKFIFQAVLLLGAAGLALVLFQGGTQINLPYLPQKTIIKKVQINDATISAEVADNQDKRKKGLSGRDSLESDAGMLFVFDAPGRYSFWMKGLKFPLDFIWIRGDQVSEVLENVKAPAKEEERPPVYQSKEDIDKILEVNAGTVEKFNIKPKDKVVISDL